MSLNPALRPLLRILCLGVVVSSAWQSFAGEAPHWIEVQSPHFSVYTDGGEKRGRDVAVRFEQMRAVFGTLMNKAKVSIPVPLQIVAFRSTKELREFSPLWNGKPTEVAGLFQAGDDRGFIMLDLSVENPWQVVFHEYAHQLMNGNLGVQVDPWFEEGFAEYFSTIEVDGHEARVGKIPDNVYEMLRQTRLMKVSDLFRVRHDTQTYNESGDRRSLFYGEAALAVHYLYDNGLMTQVMTYLDLTINEKKPVEEAIQKAFGIPSSEFDKRLVAYMMDGRFRYYRLPSPKDIVGANFTVKALSDVDSAAVKADIHLHSRDYQEKAIAEFQEILKTNPDQAIACRGLGYAYLRKHDLKTAKEYFERAANANSNDPRVHYYSAMMMSQEGRFNDASTRAEMIKHLETAIALDPSFADPYSLLSFAQWYSGDAAKGLESMQKAVELSPRNEAYQFNLAQLYVANQKWKEAVDLLRKLRLSSDPATATRAGSILADVEAGQAVLLPPQGGVQVRSERVAPSPETETSDEPMVTVVKPTGTPTEPARGTGPVRFLKGTIASIDCSQAPRAVLNVISGNKTWKMNVADIGHLIVIGADTLPCSSTKKKVAVNYREIAEGEGNIVSVEVQ